MLSREDDARLFLLSVSREFRCTICLDSYHEPTMVAGCGHVFCRDCLQRAIDQLPQDEPSRCPLCKGRSDKRSFVRVPLYAQLIEAATKLAEDLGIEEVTEMSQSAVLRAVHAAPEAETPTPLASPARDDNDNNDPDDGETELIVPLWSNTQLLPHDGVATPVRHRASPAVPFPSTRDDNGTRTANARHRGGAVASSGLVGDSTQVLQTTPRRAATVSSSIVAGNRASDTNDSERTVVKPAPRSWPQLRPLSSTTAKTRLVLSDSDDDEFATTHDGSVAPTHRPALAHADNDGTADAMVPVRTTSYGAQELELIPAAAPSSLRSPFDRSRSRSYAAPASGTMTFGNHERLFATDSLAGPESSTGVHSHGLPAALSAPSASAVGGAAQTPLFLPLAQATPPPELVSKQRRTPFVVATGASAQTDGGTTTPPPTLHRHGSTDVRPTMPVELSLATTEETLDRQSTDELVVPLQRVASNTTAVKPLAMRSVSSLPANIAGVKRATSPAGSSFSDAMTSSTVDTTDLDDNDGHKPGNSPPLSPTTKAHRTENLDTPSHPRDTATLPTGGNAQLRRATNADSRQHTTTTTAALSSKRQATEQRKQLLLRLLQTASRGVCVLCGIDVHNRAHVRNLLSLVLKSDPSADPEFLRSIDEATLEELLGGVCGPFTLHQRSVKAHYHCLLWSPEVLVRGGGITGVADAVSRGRKLKCAFCRLSGATLGCFNPRCRRSYHLACTRLTGDGVCRLYRVANEGDQGVEIPGVEGRYKLFCSRHVPSPPMAPDQRAITPVFEK
jgi:hypothetical protein